MAGEFDETERLSLKDSGPLKLLPGTVLAGRYRLDSEIGRGGMGVVFRATDLRLGRSVALKALPEAASFPEPKERLLREARSAAALNHPHIVSVHDVGEDGGIPFFVMELVAGPTLDESPPATFEEIVATGRQICAALAHAHDNRVIHRDLKPANVLLSVSSGPPAVKLADLGLAVPERDVRLSEAGAIVGTAAYMAPEQAMGGAVDGRADLYSLGVVLYELTTGRLPFTGDNQLAIVSQHVNAPVVPPRAVRTEIPRALEAVILRLLSKDPEKRFATAAETDAALARSLDPTEPALPEDASHAAAALLDVLARGRLVGRDTELAEARELWRRAREGTGHAVLLSGEPGAGKTRLAREIAVQAVLDGAVVLTGGCYEFEAATPYLPFTEAFRRWIREPSDDDLRRRLPADRAAQIARLAPELEARLGPFPARPALAAHEERLLFFDAVASTLAILGQEKGCLMFLDDLHWADASSLWLLGRLLRSLPQERILLLGTYRETELDRAHPLSKALVDWNRERLCTRLPLRRFSPGQTRAQLEAMLGEEVSPEFAEAVHRETEGNPFFVEEVLKSLIEAGAIRREGGRWSRCELKELQIPQSVKAAIGHRLDRVSAECNEVLRAAAVLGKTFGFSELTALAGERGEDALLNALDEAVASQLLVPGREEAFSFTHDKIREVLYEEQNPVRRRRLHARAAEGLERLRERRSVPIEALAHHAIHGGLHERGLQYAKQAGVEAERLFAFDEAIASYGRAAECAEALGLDGERMALEEAMGKASTAAGDLIPAAGHFEKALALAPDPRTRARLQTLAAGSLVAYGDPRGLDLVREARAVLDPESQPLETASALMIEARFNHLNGYHRIAIDLLMKAIPPAETADRSGDSYAVVTITQIYAYLSGAYQHLGLFLDGNVWARRCIDLGERGNRYAEAVGYEFLGENASCMGDWEDALEFARIEQDIAGRVHSRERLGWSHYYEGIGLRHLGRLEASEQTFDAGIALAEIVGERRLASLIRADRSVTLALAGRLDEALRESEDTIARADALNLLHLRTNARCCQAEIRLLRREFESVVTLAEDIERLASGTDAVMSKLLVGPPLVEALVALGRSEDARRAAEAYAALVGACQTHFYSSESARVSALARQA